MAWGEDVGYSESHNLNHPAFKALVALGARAIPDLLDAMRRGGNSGRDSWMRDNAAFVLSRTGPAASPAVPELIELLNAEDWNVRFWSALILGGIGPAANEAVPYLLEALNDTTLVRGGAALSLGSIGSDPGHVIPRLVDVMETEKDHETRRRMIVGLGRFGERAGVIVSSLLPFLRDHDQTVRESTAWAVREIDPSRKAFVDLELASAADDDRARFDATFRADPGLECQAVAETNRIEMGMPLNIHVTAQSVPWRLPVGVTRLNAFRIQESLRLHMTNRLTNLHLVLDIEDSFGIWSLDQGQNAELLDGRKIGPWDVSFRLVRLRDRMVQGTYDCALELAIPKTKPKYWKGQDSSDWRSFGFWSGRILSPPFPLELVEATTAKRTVLVPGPPHLDRDSTQISCGLEVQDRVRGKS